MQNITPYVIHLKKDTERLKEFQYHWMHIIPSWNIWNATPTIKNDKQHRTKACRESHTKLLEHLHENSTDEWVWIMEDDAVPVRDLPNLEPPADAMMAYHGACVHQFVDQAERHDFALPGWYRVRAWYAHSYLVRRSFIPELLRIIASAPENASIDTIYCRSVHGQHPAYMWTPIAVQQSVGESSIEGETVDRTEKILALDRIIEERRNYPSEIPLIFDLGMHGIGYHVDSEEDALAHMNLRKLEWAIMIDKDAGLIDYDEMYPLWFRDGTDTERIFIYRNDSNMCKLLRRQVDPSLPIIHETLLMRKPMEERKPGELPTVSIVTPMYRGRIWFWMALMQFMNQDYPMDKLEWVIVDEGESEVENWIPSADERIRYIRLTDEDRKSYYGNLVNGLYDKMEQGRLEARKLKHKDVAPDRRTPYRKKQRFRIEKANRSEKPAGLELVHSAMGWNVEKGADFFNRRIPIGLKRNIAVANARNEIIVHWDDDDFYPASSIRERVERLLSMEEASERKGIVGCTVIPCFDVVHQVSWMNVPPQNDNTDKRVSEATLAYWKHEWELQKFPGQAIGSEGGKFLEGRESRFFEVPATEAENIIVSLVHRSNLSIRKAPSREANGWHFKEIPDAFYQFITKLDDPTFPHEDWLVNYAKRIIREAWTKISSTQ